MPTKPKIIFVLSAQYSFHFNIIHYTATQKASKKHMHGFLRLNTKRGGVGGGLEIGKTNAVVPRTCRGEPRSRQSQGRGACGRPPPHSRPVRGPAATAQARRSRGGAVGILGPLGWGQTRASAAEAGLEPPGCGGAGVADGRGLGWVSGLGPARSRAPG